MVSRRKATVLIASAAFFSAGAWAWRDSNPFYTRLARSAAELARSCRVFEPCQDRRPSVFATVAMGLEAVGLHAEAVDLLDAGFRIAADSTYSVSFSMAKLAFAAAYAGDHALCRRCLNLARRALANDRTGFDRRRVEKYARRIRERDFVVRIYAENAFHPPRYFIDEIELRIIEGDLNAAIALATANPGRGDVGEHAVAQALLAHILARPRELVVT